MAAITNDRKLTGLKTTEIYSLRTPVARLPKSKGRQGPAPAEVPGKGPAHLLLASGGDRQPSAFFGFRCTTPSPPRSSRSPLPVCLCVHIVLPLCMSPQAFLVAQWERIHLPMQETLVQSLSREDPMEEEMATHSSILAWRIPWTEEPGGLQSMVSQRSQT